VRRLPGLCLAVACLLAAPVQAHLLNMTEAALSVDGTGQVTLALKLDLTREFGSAEGYYRFAQTPDEALGAPPLSARWESLADAIVLRQPGAPGDGRVDLRVITVVPPRDAAASDFSSPFVWPRTRVALSARVDRSLPIELTFTRAFRFEEPIATRLEDLASGLSRSRWLVARQTSPALPLTPVEGVAGARTLPWGELLDYGRAGFVHILPVGLDHLLFVLLLYLAAHSHRQLIAQISLFTLAHSATLILASYRIVEVPGAIVEPLIAASIIWVALENLRGEAFGAARYSLVFAFGLLHGLGFAGALAELGLPQGHFLLVLLAFNAGVEAGQLAFLLLLALLLGWYRRARGYRRRVVMPLSTLSALVAGFWLAQRI